MRTSSKTFTKRKNKRQCELGRNCPYISEYQHQLEFDHSVVETKTPLTSRQNVFSGRGKKLGSLVQDSSTRVLIRDESAESFFCDVCRMRFPLTTLENHIQHGTANSAQPTDSSRKRVRVEQDEEYERSVLADMKKMTEEEDRRRESQRQQALLKEREALQRAVAISYQNELEANRQRAEKRLSPEPSPEVDSRLVTKVKLRMPNGSTIVRRFLLTNSVQELFYFLHSQPSLMGFSVSVRHVFGDSVVNESCTSTFQDMKLIDCAMVVVAEPIPVSTVPPIEDSLQPSANSSFLSASSATDTITKIHPASSSSSSVQSVPSSSLSLSSSSSSKTSASISGAKERKMMRSTKRISSQSSTEVVDLT